ncbi:MAG: hypothetical protein QXL43_04350, partial [Methanolinea sp.]
MQCPEAIGKIRDQIFDREEFTRNLRAARLKKTYEGYTGEVMVQTGLALAASAAFVLVSHVFSIRFTVLKPYPLWVQDALVLGVPATMVFFTLYFQPMLVAKGRKARIDMDLPYAITYMQALSTTLTLYNSIRGVYEQRAPPGAAP